MKLNCPSAVPVALLASLACVATALSASAQNEGNDGKGNPYESIVERNPFALRPPPPPAPPDTGPPAPPPPLATVELTGVTSIFSKKKALVEIVPGPGKQPMKLTLEEGEREGSVEIVSIEVDKAEVTINNAGSVTNISLKVTKGPVAGAGVAGVPGVPGLGQPPGMATPLPTPINPLHNTFSSAGNTGNKGSITAGAAPVAPTPNFGAQPVNAYVQPPPGSVGNPGGIYANPAANPNVNPGLINRPLRTQQNAAAQPGVDPAVQYINMAVQKQTMEAKGIQMPPLPPVPGLEP